MQGGAANFILEGIQHRIHHGGMEGVGGPQALVADRLPLELFLEFLDGIDGPGHNT